MLKLCDLARIVFSVLWLLHSNGPAISIRVTTQNILAENIPQSRPTAEHESANRTNSSSPRRVTVLTKIVTISPPLLRQQALGHQNSNPSSDSSSTASDENHVRILSNHSRNVNVNEALVAESGFQPFVPNPAIEGLAPKFDSKDVYFNEYDGTGLKWGLPAKMEHSHHSNTLNDYPSYTDVPGRGSFDASYSKYYDNDYGSYGATFGPPKTDEHSPELALSIYKTKMKPLKAYPHENAWENNVHSPDHHNFVDGFTNHIKDTLDVNKAVAYNLNKIRLKSSLLHILTTLIPFGLLLHALPPKVVIINSTNSVRPESVHEKGAYMRKLAQEFLQLNDVPVNNTLNTETLSCMKLRICEAALRRNNSSSSLENYNLRLSNNAGVDLNVQDILEAAARRQCSKFTCETMTSPTAQFPNEYK